MLQTAVVKILVKFLKKEDLSVQNKLILTNLILENLQAVPFRDIITVSEDGSLRVNGREVDLEQARALRESARGALHNTAFKLIKESVVYQAFAVAATKAEKDSDLLFGKAAIWWGQEEDKLLKMLAQETSVE